MTNEASWSTGYRFYQVYQDPKTRENPTGDVLALRPDEDCKVRDPQTGKFTDEKQYNAWIPEGETWKYEDVRESYLRTYCRRTGAQVIEEYYPSLVRFLRQQLRTNDFLDGVLAYDKQVKDLEKHWGERD